MRIPNNGILIAPAEGVFGYTLVDLSRMEHLYTRNDKSIACDDQGVVVHIAMAHAVSFMKQRVPVYSHVEELMYRSDDPVLNNLLERAIGYMGLHFRPRLEKLSLEINDNDVDELLNFAKASHVDIYTCPEASKECQFFYSSGKYLKGIGPHSGVFYIPEGEVRFIGHVKSAQMQTLLSMVE